MTGAMYAALGGLKSHMSKLNVIGNNIANVNTQGYKAQRMTFKESIYTTSRSGSNGGVTVGGNNPSQVGYGTMVGSIDLNMSPSTYAPTGVGLDCMIQGEGFFMVGDKDGNILSTDDASGLLLTRVGDFWIDPEGYICNRQGKCVYGFARVQNPDYDPNAPKDPNAEGYDEKKISETIISTQLVPLRVPLSAAAPTVENGGLATTTTTDDNGQQVTVEVRNWEEGEPVYPYLTTLESQGKTYQVNNYAPVSGVATIPGSNNNNQGGGTTGDAEQVQSRMIAAVNTDPLSSSESLHVQLKSVGIDKNGAIVGTASNGDTVIVGYIAVANCDSPDGVTHVEGPYYKVMGGAGSLRVSALGGVLEGKYMGNQVISEGEDGETVTPDPRDAIVNDKSIEIWDGGLEASSTDIAEEFAQMITTQRGYQANTRIITVTDSMLEELVNMKR